MKLAIVHERLDVVGGAEKVILALHQLYPKAPIYTSFVDYSKVSETFQQMDIRPSSMQRLPQFLKRRSDKLLPFYMLAFQEFDLSEYDVVLSSSYVAAKSVLTPSHTCHISYCYTPMRFAWDLYHDYMKGDRNRVLKAGLRVLLQYFRMWDVQTSNNVDYFIGISDTVRHRLRKHYRRDGAVIYPPVETKRFRVSPAPGDYYLAVSRLVPYKRIDLAIEAFNQMDRPLLVIGDGRDAKRLAEKAGPNIRLLGWQSDEAVARYLSEARALIFPGEEDFGILPVEAQAAGTPVIAYGRGGVSETVRSSETGVFFEEQTAESLVEAVKRFEGMTFDREKIAAHACRFDEDVFFEQMETYIRQCWAHFQAGQRLDRHLPLELPIGAEIPLDMDTAMVEK